MSSPDGRHAPRGGSDGTAHPWAVEDARRLDGARHQLIEGGHVDLGPLMGRRAPRAREAR